jgi:hypothetical protein
VLEVSMLAVPRAYAAVEAQDGTTVEIAIEGNSGGVWHLRRVNTAWSLATGDLPPATATVRLDEDTAWRLFLKMLAPEDAAPRLRIEGESRLGEAFLGTLALMA